MKTWTVRVDDRYYFLMMVIKSTPDAGRGNSPGRWETAATATAHSDFSHDLLFPFHHFPPLSWTTNAQASTSI